MPDSEFFGGGDGKRSGKRKGGEEDDLYQETKVGAATSAPLLAQQ
jgi:hypothetical protein